VHVIKFFPYLEPHHFDAMYVVHIVHVCIYSVFDFAVVAVPSVIV